MKYAFALLLLFAIAVPGPSSPKVASACSCIQRTPEEIYESVDAIFYGKATDVVSKDMGLDITATVDVEKVWKGNVTETVTVHTSGGSAGCGFDEIPENEDRIFVAQSEGSFYTLSLCDGLGADDTDSVVDYFGEGSAPAANPSSSRDYFTPLFTILIGVMLGFGTGEILRRMRKIRK